MKRSINVCRQTIVCHAQSWYIFKICNNCGDDNCKVNARFLAETCGHVNSSASITYFFRLLFFYLENICKLRSGYLLQSQNSWTFERKWHQFISLSFNSNPPRLLKRTATKSLDVQGWGRGVEAALFLIRSFKVLKRRLTPGYWNFQLRLLHSLRKFWYVN